MLAVIGNKAITNCEKEFFQFSFAKVFFIRAKAKKKIEGTRINRIVAFIVPAKLPEISNELLTQLGSAIKIFLVTFHSDKIS